MQLHQYWFAEILPEIPRQQWHSIDCIMCRYVGEWLAAKGILSGVDRDTMVWHANGVDKTCRYRVGLEVSAHLFDVWRKTATQHPHANEQTLL